MSGDEFEHVDAAYVFRALSAADSRQYENHLVECEVCMDRIVQLRPLLDLLALAPRSAFEDEISTAEPAATAPAPGRADSGIDAGATSMPELLPRLLADVQQERRRRRLRAGLGAAALVACAAGLIVVLLTRAPATADAVPASAHEMTNVLPVEMQASVQVVKNDTWDQVNLWCSYRSATLPPGGGNYLAVAHGRSGRTEVVGSWPAIPGQTAVIRTPTTFPAGDISSVEITSSTGVTLARVSI